MLTKIHDIAVVMPPLGTGAECIVADTAAVAKCSSIIQIKLYVSHMLISLEIDLCCYDFNSHDELSLSSGMCVGASASDNSTTNATTKTQNIHTRNVNLYLEARTKPACLWAPAIRRVPRSPGHGQTLCSSIFGQC